MSEELDPPDYAKDLFGERLFLAGRYAEMLATEGVRHGLIGPREARGCAEGKTGGHLWHRHLVNCALLVDALPGGIDSTSTVVDIGSGAGLPGLVLAILCPHATVHVVEPMKRRVDFLYQATEMLKLTNVIVHRSRAEELAGMLSGPIVTARAVAPLKRLLVMVWPLVVPGGVFLAMKGASAARELAEAAETLKSIKSVSSRIVSYGYDIVDTPLTVVEVRRHA